MRKIGEWIVIEKGEVIPMTLAMSTLIYQVKHFSEERYRSYLCSGLSCSYCQRKAPKRIRYQVEVMIDGQHLRWEFSEEVFNTISRLKTVDGLLNITVSRYSAGRKTRYQIRQEQLSIPAVNRFTTGKYGHMVRR